MSVMVIPYTTISVSEYLHFTPTTHYYEAIQYRGYCIEYIFFPYFCKQCCIDVYADHFNYKVSLCYVFQPQFQRIKGTHF